MRGSDATAYRAGKSAACSGLRSKSSPARTGWPSKGICASSLRLWRGRAAHTRSLYFIRECPGGSDKTGALFEERLVFQRERIRLLTLDVYQPQYSHTIWTEQGNHYLRACATEGCEIPWVF